MQSRVMPSLMKPGCLRRGIVIFLVAFAFFDMAVVDLLFPQTCGDQQLSLSGASPVKSNEETAAELKAVNNHDSQPSQDSHQSDADEDCFCCCSHIIPGARLSVATLNDPPRPDDPAVPPLPLAPPHDAFHPPRLS